MDKIEALKDQLLTASSDISLLTLALNLSLAALLAWVLRFIYIRYGTSLSNRKVFARNFVLLACTTTLVIIIVKSSLALSLGLVGALSIVRFRSAIKEPEELAYLFLTIAIGLGLGADQREITLVAFAVIAAFLLMGGYWRKATNDQNLYLTVSSTNGRLVGLSQIVETLAAHCAALNLRRFDRQADMIEAGFQVEFDDFQQLEATQKALEGLGESLHFSFSDHRSVV